VNKGMKVGRGYSPNFVKMEFSEVRALACNTAILKSLPIHPSLL
jgi:hypothetical protein